MSSRIFDHIRSNVVAYVALFFALSGFAVAANETAPKDSVVTKSIKDGAVTESKLACKGNSPDDVMVRVGTVCIDKYEDSLWDAKTGGNQITGAIPCNDNGQDCKGVIFARSVAGVTPRSQITYFQAQQALANSGKQLPTSAEWQMAVAGTPDPGPSPGSEECNTVSGGPEDTGERNQCVSDWGANDMIGNLSEWVADWDEHADSCTSWGAAYGLDSACVGSDGSPGALPAAIVRGGNGFSVGTSAGPFTYDGLQSANSSGLGIGFRGSR
jgi:formylglycine-generating enzyme required for sulfatase activity